MFVDFDCAIISYTLLSSEIIQNIESIKSIFIIVLPVWLDYGMIWIVDIIAIF